MQKISLFLFVLAAAACNSGGGFKKAENAADAGREFIRASLDGDYKKAKLYLLQDADNLRMIQAQEANYNRMSAEEKEAYKEASILPVEIKPLNDSLTTYKYSYSSNPKDTTTIWVIREKGEWLVDLKSIIQRR
jgi:hypothetical protein